MKRSRLSSQKNTKQNSTKKKSGSKLNPMKSKKPDYKPKKQKESSSGFYLDEFELSDDFFSPFDDDDWGY